VIRWVRYGEIYFPHLVPRSPGHKDIAVKVQYYLTKRPGITLEEIYALVGEGSALEPAEKLFIQRYLRKLKAYNLLEENRGRYFPTWPYLSVKAVRELVELHKEELEVHFSKRTVKAWRRGERHPDLSQLMRVIV